MSPTVAGTDQADNSTHTILQLSDMHFVAAAGELVYGADPDAQFEATLAACADQVTGGVDLVLLTGDLTDDRSPAAYERLAGRVEQLGWPVIAFAGNHDDADVLARHFATPQVHDLGDWQVLCLDTARPGQVHGTVDVAAAATALGGLGEQVLVAMHHPPVSPSTRRTFSLDHDEEFLALIAASPQVKGIIAGHLHQPFVRTLPGGAPLWGCPSTLVGAIHEGDSYRNGEGTVTGAQLIELSADGTATSRLITT